MKCGHKRRTMFPCFVGRELPCIKDDCEFAYPNHTEVVKIYDDDAKKEVESFGWINSHAAMHDVYNKAKSKKEKRFWGKVITGYVLGR